MGTFRRLSGIISRSLLLAPLLVLLHLQAGLAATCPPPASAGAAIPVPGKPGETGWKVAADIKDGKGNVIQTWCLRPGNGHGGPDFAYRYIAAGGGTDVWVGGCLFAGGRNRRNFSYAGNNPNNAFDKVTFINLEPGQNGQVKRDWEFSYDPATGNLSVTKTKTTWNLRLLRYPNGTLRYALVPTTRKDPAANPNPDTYKPPAKFSDLMFNGNGITLAPTIGTGTTTAAFAALSHRTGTANSISLAALTFGGNGTAAHPFIGLPDALSAGDTFTIDGVGLSDPNVSGIAATSLGGDWMVESSSATFITFEDTIATIINPGGIVGGFAFDSVGNDLGDPWLLTSSNEESNSQGVISQVAEPSSLLLLAGGLPALLIGAMARRSKLG